MKWNLDHFQSSDKSIRIRGPLYLEVDYDDVNHSAVDILIPHLLKVLNEHWQPPTAWVCWNNECEEYGTYIEVPINPYCGGCEQTLFNSKVTESA